MRKNDKGGFKKRNDRNRSGGFKKRENGFDSDERSERSDKSDRSDRKKGYVKKNDRNREGGFKKRESDDSRYSNDKRRDDKPERKRAPYKPRPVKKGYIKGVNAGKNKKRPTPTIDSEFIRLNKYLSNAGICSRREADTFIKAGLVSVNGEPVVELGTKIKKTDAVKYNGSLIKSEKTVYILMNKPKNTLTTAKDDRGRLTVRDIIGNKVKERIYPVGRLDKDSTGVLMLTNDGAMTMKLTHPKNKKKKIYHVFLDKNVAQEDIYKLADGIELEDGFTKFDEINYANMESKREVGVELHSGKNRIVRRMFEHLGYRVDKLDRVYFAGLTKKSLRRGYWRHLTDLEVSMLKMGSFD